MTSPGVRRLVCWHSANGKTNTEIGRMLRMDEGTVRSVLKRFKATGSTEAAPRTGRKRRLSETQVEVLKDILQKKPATTLPNMQQKLAAHPDPDVQVEVDPATIARELHRQQ